MERNTGRERKAINNIKVAQLFVSKKSPILPSGFIAVSQTKDYTVQVQKNQNGYTVGFMSKLNMAFWKPKSTELSSLLSSQQHPNFQIKFTPCNGSANLKHRLFD